MGEKSSGSGEPRSNFFGAASPLLKLTEGARPAEMSVATRVRNAREHEQETCVHLRASRRLPPRLSLSQKQRGSKKRCK
jgi:hypothetical protein